MSPIFGSSRRTFLAATGATLVGAGAALAAPAKERLWPAKKHGPDDDVSPTEDLMREHGVLRRVLLVYEELIRRIDLRRDWRVDLLANSAAIIRNFIEDYHERDEEQYLFPRFKKGTPLGALVAVLTEQHQVGRRLTDQLIAVARLSTMATNDGQVQARTCMQQFIHMYEPHAAREDTVLFPAFRALASAKELDELQVLFEKKEDELPHGGFEKVLGDVGAIEHELGIDDLASMTPTLPPAPRK